MALRMRCNVTSMLLASTALLTLFGVSVSAEPHEGAIVVAQAQPPAEAEKDKKGEPPGRRPEQKPPAPVAPPKAAPPAPPPQARPPAPVPTPPQAHPPAAAPTPPPQ